ncbi:hypothetical protein KC342_g25 [Hortaea werneckii]|nr:hypothetical protein KC342_g25 [Hortaea werneckii]
MVIFISLALLFTLPVARKGALLCVAWPVDRRKHVLSDDSAWWLSGHRVSEIHRRGWSRRARQPGRAPPLFLFSLRRLTTSSDTASTATPTTTIPLDRLLTITIPIRIFVDHHHHRNVDSSQSEMELAEAAKMGQGASQPARREREGERRRERERENNDGSARESGNSRRSILRQTTRHSTVDHADYDDNHHQHRPHDDTTIPTGERGGGGRQDGGGEGGWLLQGQQQQQSQPRPRRRPHSRAPSINRLSQLLRQSTPDAILRPSTPNVTDSQAHAAMISDSDPHPHAGPSESSRRANFQRSASRFRNALSVRRSSPTRDRRPSPLSLNLLHPRFSSTRPGMNRDSAADHYSPPRLPSIDVSSTFDQEPFSPPPEDPDRQPRSSHSNRRSNSRLNALRPDRPFRHLTSSLRRRRSPERSIRRSGNEDQAAMLSRLLSVAAAATAATLMGDDHQALSEARSLTGSTMGDVGSGGEDGSFDGFLRALQNGRIASALRQGADGESDASREGPLNFFRMFRFGASGNPTPLNPGSGDSSEAGDNSEGPMVPIIIPLIRHTHGRKRPRQHRLDIETTSERNIVQASQKSKYGRLWHGQEPDQRSIRRSARSSFARSKTPTSLEYG